MNPDKTGIDLHCHSTFSDGLLSPTQLIDEAIKRGISTLSITDHDTMNGVAEAIEYAQDRNIQVIPGIEFSVCHRNTAIHVLGYGLHSTVELETLLSKIQMGRINRNKRIIDKLQALGYKISFSKLPNIKDGQLGRPHIASLLVKEKFVHSEDEAFRRFLRRGAAAYAQRDIITAQEVIEIINSACGLAVLAHPGILGLSELSLSGLINELCDIGLAGLEVYHPVNGNKLRRFLANMCHTKNLLQTGGSDFHGRDRDKSVLGEYGGGRKIPGDIRVQQQFQ